MYTIYILYIIYYILYIIHYTLYLIYYILYTIHIYIIYCLGVRQHLRLFTDQFVCDFTERWLLNLGMINPLGEILPGVIISMAEISGSPHTLQQLKSPLVRDEHLKLHRHVQPCLWLNEQKTPLGDSLWVCLPMKFPLCLTFLPFCLLTAKSKMYQVQTTSQMMFVLTAFMPCQPYFRIFWWSYILGFWKECYSKSFHLRQKRAGCTIYYV
jgi:hypothetical protein